MEPSGRRRRADPALVPLARTGHARVGVRRLGRSGRRASASSTAASSASHPLVGEVDRAVAVQVGEDDEAVVDRGRGGRSVRPRHRVRRHRPLDRAARASWSACACSAPATPAAAPSCSRGLRWAIEQGFDVINMSLSTTKQQFAGLLHELADSAYFRRTVLVASAHNMPVESYPVALLLGASRSAATSAPDPLDLLLQPRSAGRVLRPRASTSTSPGWTAARSARPATASRRRTSPASAR